MSKFTPLSDELHDYIVDHGARQDDVLRRVQDESPLVGLELQCWRPFAPPPWRMPPTLVLGGADDRFVPSDEVRRTAAYYGTRPVIVPRLAHVVMLDPRWDEAAAALLGWLEGLPR